jgi:hypothetical protein
MRPSAEVKPERFRFFISYASEDYNIAIAVSNAIQTATGPSAEVFMDVALTFGDSFLKEIKTRLDETNVLVVIHSGILKSAFAYPGLELGYFLRIMESETREDFPRRIVPVYMVNPPDAVKEREGIDIGISRATLNMTVEAYKAELNDIDWDHSAVKFLRQFQDLIDSIREKHGASKIRQTEEQRDLPGLVRKMQLAIFNHLKTTPDPESTLKPQLQILLRTNDDALSAASDGQLPDDACLIPVGGGKPMSIFGLPPTETTWGNFRQQTRQNKFADSWIDAITRVVTYSMQNQLAVDNSQIVVSYDEKSAYRVILTTGTRYFNGDREFNLYLVEHDWRGEFGDPDTTLLFKGLEILCRFRSLFLERRSEFSSMACRVARVDDAKVFAGAMERELNLLYRDSLEAGLGNPSVWLGLLDPKLLLSLSQAWLPLESRLREALTQTRRSEPATVGKCREALITVLAELEAAMRPINTEMIAVMADKLKTAPASAL